MTDDASPWAAAACAGSYDLFEAADQGNRWAAAEALRLCREVCPIVGICLETTLTYERRHSSDSIQLIAGGLTPSARAALLGLHLPNKTHARKKATAAEILPVQMPDKGLLCTNESAKET